MLFYYNVLIFPIVQTHGGVCTEYIVHCTLVGQSKLLSKMMKILYSWKSFSYTMTIDKCINNALGLPVNKPI